MGLFGKLKKLNKKLVRPLRKPAGKIARVAGPVLAGGGAALCGPYAPVCHGVGVALVAREKVVTARDNVKRANTIQERLNRDYILSSQVGSDLRMPTDLAPTSYQTDEKFTLYRAPTDTSISDAYGLDMQGLNQDADNIELTDDYSGLTPEQKAMIRSTSARAKESSRAGVPWFLILGLAAAYYAYRRSS